MQHLDELNHAISNERKVLQHPTVLESHYNHFKKYTAGYDFQSLTSYISVPTLEQWVTQKV